MPVPDFALLHGVSHSSVWVGLVAYGPAPGMELIPYFLALLAWVGTALAAIFLSPILALYRRLRGTKTPPAALLKNDLATATSPESRGDDTAIRP